LLNVLIQGSAADCTKEAIIRADAAVSHETNFMLSVHDQLVFDTPKKMAKSEMLRIREALESVEFDIPMLSDGKTSAKSWGALIDTKEAKTWPRKIA
jgi:DNA polymerase-1